MSAASKTGRWPAPRYTVAVVSGNDVETYGVFRDLRAARRLADRIAEEIDERGSIIGRYEDAMIHVEQIRHADSWRERWDDQ